MSRLHRICVCSDVGHIRSENQDNYLLDLQINEGMESSAAADCTWEDESQKDDLVPAKRIRLFAVFDGMGGEQHGGEAARLAAEELKRCAHDLPPHTGWKEAAALVRAAMESAGERILLELSAGTGGSGTTATVMMTDGDAAMILHAGDSRAYRLRGGKLEQLTRDQTVAAFWEERGMRPPSRAMYSQLMVFLGDRVGRHGLEILETEVFSIEEGDRFLLCTDGLYAECGEEEIVRIMSAEEPEEMAGIMSAEEPEGICASLVQAALKRGGWDNVTALVLV